MVCQLLFSVIMQNGEGLIVIDKWRKILSSSVSSVYLCVDVTFGYLGFSYFIDKEMLNKFFMRVACAEMAFFF